MPQNIYQGAYSNNSGAASDDYYMKGTFFTSNAYYLKKVSEVAVESRYAYALDIDTFNKNAIL